MTSPIRLQADHERLRALADASGQMIALLKGPTAAVPQADVELRYAIARSEHYPADVTRQTRLRIALLMMTVFSYASRRSSIGEG